MSHETVAWGELYARLHGVDERLVEEAKRAGCRRCGGRLDRADFPRKPRGAPAEAERHLEKRFGLCCAREGCRRRTLPPSVRFLGRHVYTAVAVVTACLAQVRQQEGWQAARRLRRWCRWWREVFGGGAIFAELGGQLVPPVDVNELPGGLFARVAGGGMADRLVSFIAMIAGVSVAVGHDERGGIGDTQRMVLGKMGSAT